MITFGSARHLRFNRASAIVMLSLFAASSAHAVELIIGEEKVAPGAVFIFEGAPKDMIEPKAKHLDIEQTDVHIEARVNWSEDDKIPESAPPGGFVPYLEVNVAITSQNSGDSAHVTLTPHVNLIDNFHYARNIALPGKASDKYEVVFHVNPPDEFTLAFHKDWIDAYGGASLLKPQTFRYRDVDFEAIAKAARD